MAKKRRKKLKTVTILVIAGLLAFCFGFAFTAGGVGERASWFLRELSGRGEQTQPPGDNQGDPENPNNPGEPGSPGTPGDPSDPGDPDNAGTPGEPGDQPGDPVSPGKKPGDPVIYEDQVLIIPGKTSGSGGGPARTVSRGTVETGEKRIALTFDSGWLYDQTIPLLDMLDRYGVKATFFPRALWARDNPELAREIVRRGHAMGNHSLTHPHMRELSADQVRHEMRESTRIIQEVTGVRPYLFRPPYGEYNQQVLNILGEEGYPYNVLWTVDTHDWAETMGGQAVTVDYIVNRVLHNASPNGIVLMHIAHAKTVQALPRMIEGLRERGYTFATVDQMLPPPAGGPATHAVQKGETLFGIAREYGVTVQQIIDANGLR